MLQGRHLVQDDAQAPDVALEVVGAVLDDFGAEVIRRAHHGLGVILGGVQHPRDAEVAQLDLPGRHEENILGLQVAVQDLAVVHVLEGEVGLHEPLQDHLLAQEQPVAPLDLHVDVAAVRVIHDDAEPALPCHEHLLKSHNVPVVHPLQHDRLLDRLFSLLLPHHRSLHLLDHTELICLGILDQISLAERALAEHLDPLVLFVHAPVLGLLCAHSMQARAART
mmetsp:Transcript_78579/g.240445  ORF Transcript_78579/g.240445 Transcript_78579/m.240445 type:complete len:223 (+) Transcript_78579:296-964(+)